MFPKPQPEFVGHHVFREIINGRLWDIEISIRALAVTATTKHCSPGILNIIAHAIPNPFHFQLNLLHLQVRYPQATLRNKSRSILKSETIAIALTNPRLTAASSTVSASQADMQRIHISNIQASHSVVLIFFLFSTRQISLTPNFANMWDEYRRTSEFGQRIKA